MCMKPAELENIRKKNSNYFNSLRQGQDQGILTSGEVLLKCTMKKEQIIKDHEAHHSIFLASDGRWKTRLPDGNGKGKLIAKRNKADLDKAIVEFYLEQQEEINKNTFRALYPGYKKQKQNLEKLADASIERYQNSWDFLVESNAEIVDYDVTKLTRGKYKIWAMEFLSQHPMTKKTFDTIQTVLKGIVRYALDRDLIASNPLTDLTLPRNCFIEPSYDSRKEPFNDDEVKRLAEYLWGRYESDPEYTVPLAILFLFQTGLRPAEAEALCFSDIDSEHYLHVQRHQAKAYGNNGKLSESEIKNTVKTKARKKPVYLSEEARNILDLVQQANEANGDVKDDYIFYNDHKHLTTAAINRCLNTACEKAKIPSRCVYMIRKTYCSVLADAGINLTMLSSAMGHAEPSTTLRFYIKDRNTRSETSEQMERALSENIPSRESVTPSVTLCNTKTKKKKVPKPA